MTYLHKNLADGSWQDLSLVVQLANVGSEVILALKLKEKENDRYSQFAFHRALELLSLSIDDPKNLHRLKELTRCYEVIVDYFFGENTYQSDEKQLVRYFMNFNLAARAEN